MVSTMQRIIIGKRKYVAYYLDSDKIHVIEDNLYTKHKFVYDLTSRTEKLFFQQRLKHNSKYGYQIRLDSYCIYYLHFLRWL